MADYPTLGELLQHPDVLLQLEPEELAGYLTAYFNALEPREQDHLQIHNLWHFLSRESATKSLAIARAVGEGWLACANLGLIAPDPDSQNKFWFVTRLGQKVQAPTDLKLHVVSRLLRRDQIHQAIAEKAWPDFIRGSYEGAILNAFKEVEIAVRNAGGFTTEDFGVKLMRKAFHTESGPLADRGLAAAERQSMLELFTGAIGLLKNPASHRHVELDDPGEAAELIGFASYLMRIVEERQAANKLDENGR
jgi:uncharacterized protein (TIGR02391 family)